MSYSLLVAHPLEIVGLAFDQICKSSEFVVTSIASQAELEQFPAGTNFDLIVVSTGQFGNPTNGFQFGSYLIQKLKPKSLLFISKQFHAGEDSIVAIELGAAGIIEHSISRPNLLVSLRKAIGGHSFWTSQQQRRHLLFRKRIELNKPTAPLTTREHDVLLEISRGQTNTDIADTLGISYETAKEHVTNILRKLRLNDRTQAAIWAVRNDLI